jgi:hypothetical protein
MSGQPVIMRGSPTKPGEITMFGNPSLITRIAIGKTIGLVVGIIGFFSLPAFLPEADLMLRWGILLWYLTFGAIIGVFGVLDNIPLLKLPLPWWIRAPFIGAWMNFVLAFFAYDNMQAMMISVFGADGALQSPFWFAAEGAIIGLVIGYFATRFGGEGAATAGN